MEGKSLEEASRFANCTASLAIEKIGATTAIRSRAQADERYADYLRETGLSE
jgi:sugar/nucleoside kinase (ribokinase family)